MAEDIMESPGNGVGFTQKEMLVRIEGKVDQLSSMVAAKHAHYDVELALLKARDDEQSFRENAMNSSVRDLKEGQITLGKGLRYATATLAGLLIASDAIARFLGR